MKKVHVLFVCLGNICRSPTAHGIFQNLVDKADLNTQILVDSAGTGDWHVGKPPDRRAIEAAKGRDYDLQHLRARQVSVSDFSEFDYILAMDKSNLHDLRAMCPANYQGQLKLFLEFANSGSPKEVPDPYTGGESEFQYVLNLIEDAANGLLEEVRGRLRA